MHDPSGAQVMRGPSVDPISPVREFVDPEGVTWEVVWCDAATVRRRMRSSASTGSGLVFSTKTQALIYHLPMRHPVDPRLLTTSQLATMVDHAFDCPSPRA